MPHEYVHTLVYQVNSDTPLWLNEGLALYLTNGQDLKSYDYHMAPTFKEIQTNNPIKFSNIGGYTYAQTYIEFLDETYGFDSVLEFLYGEQSYKKSFGASDQEVYDQWIAFLKDH